MTAYVTIAPTDYDPDSPITTSLAGAWSNNLLAAFEGNATFQLQHAAMDPGVAGWGFIEQWTPTAVTFKNFTWDESLYSDIMVIVEGVEASASDTLGIRIGYSDGTTIPVTGYAYSSITPGSATVSATAAASHVALGNSPGPTITLNGTVELAGLGGTAWYKKINARMGTGFTATDTFGLSTPAATTAIDTIQLFWVSSSNFGTTGNVSLYGLLKPL